MSTPASHLLAGVVLDAGLKATVVLGAALLADRLLPKTSAAASHALWSVVVLSLPGLALAGWALRGPDLAVESAWIGGLWALGAAVAAAPQAAGGLWLEAVCRRGTVQDGIVRARAGDVAGPLTFGWWRPRVVVPADWDRWEPGHREAALAHEQAHIDRNDWAVQSAASLVCALFWFHPLVWLARARLVDAAERAADDRVLIGGHRPSDYAHALLRLSQAPPDRAGLAAGRSAEARIRAVLDGQARSAKRWPAALVLAAELAVLVPALAILPAWSPAPPPLCTPIGAQP